MTILEFQKAILDWYKTNRRDMPWRNTKDPYKILVSEIMLQQTQVSRVLLKYKEFLEAFPTLESLAKASDQKLLKIWQGLGYWRRARYLKQIAQHIGSKSFPKDPHILDQLPGIGHYTARALACFAFQNHEAFLDTNIRRVYLHFFFKNKKDVPDKKILKIAQKAVWKENPREWHYALFDYGALVLKDKLLNKQSKHYHKQNKFEGSFRSFRTKVMRFLLDQKQNKVSMRTIETLLKDSPYPSDQIISSLLKDNLIKQSATYYHV